MGIPFDEIFLNDDPTHSLESERLQKLSGSGAELYQLPQKLFSQLCYGDRSDPVIAVCQRPATDLNKLDAVRSGVVIVLESMEKPGNLGAVIRTADAAGMGAVLIADPLSDPFHPNAIRASVSCVFGLPLAIGSSEAVQRWLVEREFQIVVALVDGETRYDQVDFTQPSAIVLGNEANGLSPTWSLLDCSPARKMEKVHLPMLGFADSLNVSTTAAALCYEAARQNGFES